MIANPVAQSVPAAADAEMTNGVGRELFFSAMAVLSHELRNPLAAVTTAAQVIGRSIGDRQTIEQACEVIERQARQAARLLDELLDVGRMMQGRIVLKKNVVDLVTVVKDAAAATRQLFQSRNHRLHLQVPEQAVTVDGDRSRLLQIVENLLTNASKHTPSGGEIRVQLSRDGATAVLAVHDTGNGIAPEHLDAVFELFTQLDTSLDRSERGLGVGLSLVKMLVEMHGGQVLAASDGTGKGSCFTVRLPVVECRSTAADQDGNGSPTRPVSVLIVEDMEDSRRILRRLLSLDGHEVREARDGLEGLASLLSQPPDVALVDVGLPGLDGYEVARSARKNAALNRVRLVALTGYGRPEDHEAVMAAGFDNHLVKPVSPAELIRVLRLRDA